MTDPVSQTAGETLRAAGRTGPVWGSGTAQGFTDEEGEVQVLLDGPPSTAPDDTDTSTDANQPVTASVLCGSVADQEKVRTVFTPDGSLFVIGSMGGQPHGIGAAVIEGGNIDIAIVSTAATEITDLRAEAVVAHPGHLIKIEVAVYLQSGGANNTLIGRVRREEPDGTLSEIGRFLRSSGMGNGETIMAGPPCYDIAPDPGVYEFYPTVQASVTGWSIILDPSTTPQIAASLIVTDMGALPPGFATT